MLFRAHKAIIDGKESPLILIECTQTWKKWYWKANYICSDGVCCARCGKHETHVAHAVTCKIFQDKDRVYREQIILFDRTVRPSLISPNDVFLCASVASRAKKGSIVVASRCCQKMVVWNVTKQICNSNSERAASVHRAWCPGWGCRATIQLLPEILFLIILIILIKNWVESLSTRSVLLP